MINIMLSMILDPLQMIYANDHGVIIALMVVMMMMMMLIMVMMILMIMMIKMMIMLSLVICGCHHCKPFARRLHGERLMKPFLQKM